LSRTTGPVLDPIFGLRRRVDLEAEMTARIAFVTGATDSHEAAIGLAERFGQLEAIDRVFADARVHSDRERRELELSPQDSGLFDRLAASVVFTNSSLRYLAAVAANRMGQPGLWPHSISGDLPIVLARVARDDDEGIVRQLVRWRTYTRRRGLKLDLVILDERVREVADRLRAELVSCNSRD
jgi:cellobiose phosphorylase